MRIVFLNQTSPEWEKMWKWLETHPINTTLESPSQALHMGEAWQYMGTFTDDTMYIHTLRHRNHPLTQEVLNVSVKAMSHLVDEDFEK